METLIEIIKREEGDVIIFDFTGELDETNADKTFKDIYEQVGNFDEKKIIFNRKKCIGICYNFFILINKMD